MQADPQHLTFGSTALVLAHSKNSQFLEENQVIVTLPGCLQWARLTKSEFFPFSGEAVKN